MASQAPPHPSDDDLCRALASSAEAAFAELYTRYYQRLLDFAARLLEPPQARDVVRQVFERVLREARALPRRGPFAVYVFTAAYQACSPLHRHPPAATNDQLVPAQPSDEPTDLAPFRGVLLDQLPHLDFERRAAFLLHFQEGFPVDTIAHIMGCPLGSAKSRLFYAARLLTVRLRGLPAVTAQLAAASLSAREEH